MKRNILAVMLVLCVQFGIFGQNSSPIDLVLLLNTSADMSSSYENVSNYITGPFLSEYLRIGDTFHLITFSANSKLDSARRISGIGDIETIIGRMFIQYPVENGGNMAAALSFTERYLASLPLRSKKVVVVSTGSPEINNLVNAAKQRFSQANTTLDFVQVTPGQPLTGLPSSGRPSANAAPTPSSAAGTASQGTASQAAQTTPQAAGTASQGTASQAAQTTSPATGTTSQGATSQAAQASSQAAGTASQGTASQAAQASSPAAGTASQGTTSQAAQASSPAAGTASQGTTSQAAQASPQAAGTASQETTSQVTQTTPQAAETASQGTVSSAAAPSTTETASSIPSSPQTTDSVKQPAKTGSFSFHIPVIAGIIALLLLILIIIFIASRKLKSSPNRVMAEVSKSNDDRDQTKNKDHNKDFAKYAAVQTRQRTTPYSDRPLKPENAAQPKINPTGPLLLNMFVEDQNTLIGKRNIHSLKSGYSLTVGGGKSDFLIFLVPVPANIGEVRRSGSQLSFIPRKPKLFPDLGSSELRDCLNKTIRIISDKGYELRFRFEMYEDPLETLNRVLLQIKVPG